MDASAWHAGLTGHRPGVDRRDGLACKCHSLRHSANELGLLAQFEDRCTRVKSGVDELCASWKAVVHLALVAWVSSGSCWSKVAGSTSERNALG